LEFDALRAAVVPGAAVVGRWPGIVCVAECADRQVLRRLLDVCASAGGPEPGRTLARRLTMWLGGADAPGEGLRFGTVAVAGIDTRSAGMRGEQWAVFLYGPVGLVVPDRQVALSGAQAVAWTDRLLPRPDVPVVLALEGGPIPPGVIDGVHDLRSGVVPGAGAVLVPGGHGDGRGADSGEETARRRPDDPPWIEPGERERPRWGGPSPEPALAAQPDGLHQGGEGLGKGASGRSALDDLAPGPGPDRGGDTGSERGTDLGTDRNRLGDRGRAHLRPVPSGSNGIGHRGRLPRRATALDLGRFGGGPGRRDAGPGVGDGGDPGAGRAAPPGDPDETGPPGPDVRRPAADEGPTVEGEIPTRAGDETPRIPGFGGSRVGVNGIGLNVAVPDDLSSLDAPFGDLSRAEPARTNGSDVLGRTGNHDGTGQAGADHGGTGAEGTGRNGHHNGADRGRDLTWPHRAEGHWFATPDDGRGTETEPGSVPPEDARRPRHGRQEATLPADVPADPTADDSDNASAGTPRLGLHTVPPAASLPAVAPVPEPPAEPEQSTSDQGPLRAEPILGAPSSEPSPAPLEAGEAPGTVETPEDPLDDSRVRGRLCPRGHLNDPRLGQCATCGTRLEDTGEELVVGPRPALGLIVFDDGTTYTVDGEYLVGRMPEADPRVVSGALRSLSVEDPSGAVSRVHAEVRVSGWDVLLTDVGSRNGTFVSGPGDPEWTQLPAGQTQRLVPGARVRLGGRSFLFESPSGAR
jgi:hypothetical protein